MFGVYSASIDGVSGWQLARGARQRPGERDVQVVEDLAARPRP